MSQQQRQAIRQKYAAQKQAIRQNAKNQISNLQQRQQQELQALRGGGKRTKADAVKQGAVSRGSTPTPPPGAVTMPSGVRTDIGFGNVRPPGATPFKIPGTMAKGGAVKKKKAKAPAKTRMSRGGTTAKKKTTRKK